MVNYTAVTGETIVETPFTYDISRAPFVSGSCNWAGETINNVSSSAFTPGSDMAPGTYCWRVRTLDVHGLAGAWSGHWTLTIESVAVNVPPVATNDDASGTEDTAGRDRRLRRCSSNDTNGGDGGTLSLTQVSNPRAAPSSINGANVDFTPTANLCGLDAASFVYTVSDGTDTDTGTVTIDLTCVNDPPVATDDNASGTEDTLRRDRARRRCSATTPTAVTAERCR